MKKSLLAAGLGLGLLVAVTGCTSDTPSGQTGASISVNPSPSPAVTDPMYKLKDSKGAVKDVKQTKCTTELPNLEASGSVKNNMKEPRHYVVHVAWNYKTKNGGYTSLWDETVDLGNIPAGESKDYLVKRTASLPEGGSDITCIVGASSGTAD